MGSTNPEIGPRCWHCQMPLTGPGGLVEIACPLCGFEPVDSPIAPLIPPEVDLLPALLDVPDVPEIGLPEVPAPTAPFTFMKIEDQIMATEGYTLSPNDVQVIGRFFPAPKIEVTVFPSRILIRLDDDRDPEQWVQIVISDMAIETWMRQMIEADEVK